MLPFLLVKHAVPEGLARVKPVAALPALLQITAHDPECVSRFPLHRVQHEPNSLIGVLIANLPNDWNVWVVFGMLILSPGLLGLCSA